jgi:predicted sugar kinase
MEDPDYQKAQARTRSSNFSRKYRKLHMELCEVIEDFSLLSFLPLAIQDAESVGRVVARVDKCNGYVFLQENQLGAERGGVAGSKNINMQNMFSSAIVADSEWGTGVLADVQEKYLGEIMFKEDISELRKR